VIFIKLFRVLTAVLAIGLICHLLCSVAKKNMTTRPRKKDSKADRKFVESSVIERKDETPESEENNS